MKLVITSRDAKIVIIIIGMQIIIPAAFVGYLNTLDPPDRGAASSVGALVITVAWFIFLAVMAAKMVNKRFGERNKPKPPLEL
jgi:hypothetical protein